MLKCKDWMVRTYARYPLALALKCRYCVYNNYSTKSFLIETILIYLSFILDFKCFKNVGSVI